MAKGIRGRLLWYLCARRGWEVWSARRGNWLLGKPAAPGCGDLLWELAALGKADHVFMEHQGCLPALF